MCLPGRYVIIVMLLGIAAGLSLSQALDSFILDATTYCGE